MVLLAIPSMITSFVGIGVRDDTVAAFNLLNEWHCTQKVGELYEEVDSLT